MIKLTSLVLLLNITNAQGSHIKQNKTGKSHLTRIIVPKITESAIYFQETIGKERENLFSRKKNRCCLLLQNLAQQTGRNLMNNCCNKAVAHRRPELLKMENYERNGLKEELAQNEESKKEQDEAQREIILHKIEQSVNKNLKNLEKMFTNFLILEKSQSGFIRMT